MLDHSAGSCIRFFYENDFELTTKSWLANIRLDFPYMQQSILTGRRSLLDKLPVLLETYRSVAEAVSMHCQQPLLNGGKQMGGQIGSLLADSLNLDCLIQGAVCLGYPFHPSRKPEQLRTAHLKSLRAPMLIVQGELDPMGGLEEILNYDLSEQIQIR